MFVRMEVYKMEDYTDERYYKDKIIEMVEKIENQGTLKYIYNILKTYLKSRG